MLNKINIQIGLTDDEKDAVLSVNGVEFDANKVGYLFLEMRGGDRATWLVTNTYHANTPEKNEIRKQIEYLIERLKK